jgi:hypothetical protein
MDEPLSKDMQDNKFDIDLALLNSNLELSIKERLFSIKTPLILFGGWTKQELI